MPSAIHHLTAIRYSEDGMHWDTEEILSPSWQDVESAIRRMDNNCFPLVQLNPTDNDEHDEIFNICGGEGRWAMFQLMGDWQYEEAGGGEGEVRLWESDQGYYCRRKNVLTDIEKVLRITKTFFDTASYTALNPVC